MTSQSALECLCRSPIDCDHSSADWRYPSTADHCLAYCQGGIAATVNSAELPEHCLNIPRQCCAVARYVSTAYGDISGAWVRGALTFAWVILSVCRPTLALLISQDKDRLHHYRFSVRFFSWTFDKRTSQSFLEGPDHFTIHYLTNSIPLINL